MDVSLLSPGTASRSLARSARVRATESKSGCSHRACGNRQARDGVGEGEGGDVGVEGWDEEGHWRGVLPSAKQRQEGLVSLSGQGRHSTGRDSTET